MTQGAGVLTRKILLMGLRRSGKSSIRQVIFHGMQPIETLYLESTTRITSEVLKSLGDFVIEEIPGQHDVMNIEADLTALFQGVSSVIYVIDSQDEYLMALQNVVQVIEQGYKVNQGIHFEVLVHKIDGLNDEFRLDTKRDIIQRINDDLIDIGVYDADITYHMTSIFDQSIIEASSRIIQKLVPELSSLTQMLDLFTVRTGIEKVFLFDSATKLYIATDSSPVDAEICQVCSDFISISSELGALYNSSTSKQQVGQDFSLSRLQNGTIITLAHMFNGLLLVGLSTHEVPMQATLTEFNMEMFRDGMKKIYEGIIPIS